ncbi:MAG TPA: zinc ribbon domain-containing protein [Sedimentisphaerales bacterium]|nr:zinc ribbon domain-containing protein [Sedimentisphaerales bacterium]
MPTYEYICEDCGHRFEQFQSITAKPLRKCPKCGKSKLARLIGTGAGIIFKGSGFYQTDYRSESYTKDSKTDAPAPAEKSADKAGQKNASGDTTATTPVAQTPSAKGKKTKDA